MEQKSEPQNQYTAQDQDTICSKEHPTSSLTQGGLPTEEVAAARAEDIVVAATLRRARVEYGKSAVSADSVQQNEAFMEKMRVGSERALARRIKSKELISQDELVERLEGKRRWVNEALRAGRLFSLMGPSGLEYFPAFFADGRYDRRALGKVVQALEGLPNESKYFFFTRKSRRLGTTALEAMAQGRTVEVIACAVAFSTV